MNHINGLVSSCILALAASGCSALTKWPDVNDNTATKGGTAGSTGEDEAGGSATRGGTSSKGGATNLGGTSAAGKASTGGIESSAGTSSNSGGATNVGGTSSSNGGGTSIGGASTSVAGTSSTIGGAAAATGGIASTTSGGQGGATVVGTGGKSMSGGATSSAVGGVSAQGGVATQGGASGTSTVAGTGGVDTTLAIATPALATGKTGAAYTATVTASGATTYTWSIASGTLPAGVTLQGTTTASVTVAGTPKEVGLFPLTLSVTDGTATKTIDVSLAVTHKVAFLADRITSGVKELFLTEVGTETAGTPVRLNTPLLAGGVTSYTWSPDGAKVAYLSATNRELLIASTSNPGAATSVATGVTAYTWLALGQTLAVGTATGTLYLVDVAGSAPWTKRTVSLPAPPTGENKQFLELVASPVDRSLLVSTQDIGTVGSPSACWVHFVNWTGSTNITAAAVTQDSAGLYRPSFSPNGKIVTVSGPSFGTSAFVVSDPLAPQEHNLVGPVLWTGKYSWSKTSPAVLCEYAALSPTDVGGIMLYSYVGGAWHQQRLVTCAPPGVGPWSPDSANALIACGNDLRAVTDVANSAVGADVSILPSGFLLNSFTTMASYGWSGDSKWIALRADKEVDNLFDIYLMRWPSVATFSRPYTSSAIPGVSTWQFAPDSSSVVFVGTIGTSTSPELYLTTLPATGAPSTASPLTAATDPAVQDDIAWLPGSRVILYRANDAGGTQLHAIHVSATGTSSASISVSGTGGTGVPSYQLAPLP